MIQVANGKLEDKMDDRGEIRSARGYGDTEVLGARWLASQPRDGSESTGIPRA